MEQVASDIKNQLPECILIRLFKGYIHDTYKTNTILSSLIYSKSMLNKCIWGAQEVDVNLTSLNQSGLLHLKHQVFSLGCNKTANLPYMLNGQSKRRTEHKKTWEKHETKRATWCGKGQEEKSNSPWDTTERVSESQKWLSPGWQAYGRRKKNTSTTCNSIIFSENCWMVISVTMVRPHKRNFWHSKVTFKALSKTTSLIQDREGREVLFFTGGIDPPWEFITVSVCKFTIPNETQHLLWLYSTHGTCFLFIYWSGTILGSLNLNLSTRPVKNMGPKWPTTYHLCKGADNDVWPVGRWWHRKPPSSWDFPCKPLREASLSKLSSRMIRPKMDRLSSWELWKSASQKGGVSVRGQKHVM